VQYSTLGDTGIQVSKLCLGMMSYGSPKWQRWALPYESGEHFVRRALEAGINFFDTADFYSYGVSEEILGRAVKTLTERRNIVLSTKVGLPMSAKPTDVGLSRKHLVQAVDASLRRLQTDYVDIYMLHDEDPRTPIEETMDVMVDLVKSGKVLYVGFSNLPTWKAAHAVYYGKYHLRSKPKVSQIQYNLCYREDERDMLPLCVQEKLGVMVYSPLARGWLAGNRTGASMGNKDALRAESDAKARSLYGSEQDAEILKVAAVVAGRHGVRISRVAMAWILSNPAVSSMICGVLEDAHLDEAIAALDLELNPEDLEELAGCYQAQQVKSTGLAAVLANVGK
jgi:aryl-alcohol dehydrogenase-like predicted oxidoreductase